MKNQPHREQTFIILKPDTVQRSLIGEVIKRIERTGLKCVAMKMFEPDEKRLLEHYNKSEEWFLKKGQNVVKDLEKLGLPVEKEAIEYGRDIIRTIVRYMTSGPVVAMVWEGNQAVNVVMKIVGTTEPTTSDVGTIRSDYTLDSYSLASFENRAVRNLVHCSDSPDEAKREMNIWFTEEEKMRYIIAQERFMYDVNLDGMGE